VNSYEEYILINLEAEDRFGSSSITLEGLDYGDAWEEIKNHLKFLYQTERFVDITLSIKIKEETTKTIQRKLKNVGYSKAKDAIAGFLKYAYRIEDETLLLPAIESPIEPIFGESSWLSNYDLENLTQKEKVFLLLKYNHPGHWVKSQELQKEYKIVYGEQIKLSSLSTYLARFYEKGSLERRGSRAQREYLLKAASSF